MDQWNGRYRRAVMVGERPVSIEVRQAGGVRPALTLSVLTPGRYRPADLDAITAQAGRLLGTNVDLEDFYRLADADPRLAELVARFVGVRPPRFPTLFEAMVNAIANQQLSLEVGIELLNRLTARFGARPPDGHGLVAFPDAASMVEVDPAELRGLGFSTRKAEYIVNSAHAVVSGEISTSRLEACERGDATELLLEQRGIGRWSAEYILLRGLGRLDVFPADDVGARNKLQRMMGLSHPPDRDEIISMTAPWSPWAGVVYFHLLLDGLARNGDIDG
jgi:DNA-3-methyladenine glycosylase II